jgi:hypothetical protein
MELPATELFALELSTVELSRATLEALGPAVRRPRFFRRAALEHAERKEASEGGEAKHQGGLLAGEIRGRAYEVLDRLSAQILRKFLRPVRHAANDSRKLRDLLFKVLGSDANRIDDVMHHVGAGGHLHVEKTLRLLGGIGRE